MAGCEPGGTASGQVSRGCAAHGKTQAAQQLIQAAVFFHPAGQSGAVHEGQGLAGLYQAQMARAQIGRALARQQAQQGKILAQRGQGRAQQVGVAWAAHMGADQAQKGKGGFVGGPGRAVAQKTFGHGRCGLPQAAGVQTEQHGQAQPGRQKGRAACAPVSAVKKAHGPFHHNQVRRAAGRVGRAEPGVQAAQAGGQLAARRCSGRGPGRAAHPGIQVGGGLARKRGVEGHVDEVRAGFGGARRQASGAQGAEQGQSAGGLAAGAARAGHHAAGGRDKGGGGHGRSVQALAVVSRREISSCSLTERALRSGLVYWASAPTTAHLRDRLSLIMEEKMATGS